MSNNFANFNAAFPAAVPGGASNGRGYNAAPMTMAPQRSAGPSMPGAMARELNLRPHEQQLFDQLFYSCDGSRTVGLVSGAAIKNLFTQSRLPKQSLAAIWNLSDRQKRKVLDLDDFYLACRLIAIAQQSLPITMQSVKTYTDIPLPQFEGNALQAAGPVGMTLAPIPAQQAPAGAQPRKMPPMTMGGPGLGTGLPANQAGPRGVDLLGAAPLAAGQNASFPVSLGRAPSIGTPQAAVSPMSAAPVVDEWSMTDTERTQYISLFSQADADGDGFVGGKEANLFFKQSGLDNATLKQIWLLADVDRDNRLNPDEFSIAMHLTLKVRKKQPLPAVLPASMDPRLRQQQQQQPQASPAELDSKTGKAKLNLDMLPDLLPQPVTQQQPDLLGGFDAGAPGGRPNSKPASRRASTVSADFGGAPAVLATPQSFVAGFGNGLPTPNAGQLGFAGGFNQSVMTPQQMQPQPTPSGAQGYHMIEATQALEDRTAQLATLTNQTDQTKRSIGQAEARLEAKLKEVEQVTVQVQGQEKLLEEQRAILAGVEAQFHEAEQKLVESKARLAEAQEQLKQGDAKIKSLQEQTAGFKRETQEADMSLTLLESQLTSLRSSLTGVEQLKENQMTILQARREQQNRLLLEKADIAELLQSSKRELQQIKEQAQILKDGISHTQESVDELREVLQEHREIVKQEKLNPSASMPRQSPTSTISPVTSATAARSSPSTGFPSSADAKKANLKAAAFSFGNDDDAYNIDDIEIPGVNSSQPAASSFPAASASTSASKPATSGTAAIAPPVTAPTIVVSPSSAITPTAAAPSSAPAPAAPPAAAAPVASPASAKSVFDEDDDWSKPAATIPAAAPAQQVSPFSANSAAQVPLPAVSASPPAAAGGDFDDPFGSASVGEAGKTAPPTHRSTASSSSFASPPAPAVPTFPSALEGTGVPDFPSPADSAGSANPWENDDASDPFGAPDAAASALSPQAAFGELDDPFGGPGAAAEDPFGSSSNAPGEATQPTGPNAFDDFADFGSPAATAVTSPPTNATATKAASPAAATTTVSSPAAAEPTKPAAAPLDKKAAVAASFDAAMSEDWAAFD